MNPCSRILLSSTAALLLTACQTTQDTGVPLTRDDLAVPERWIETHGSQTSSEWIAAFAAPKLESLVAEALANNLGLENAYQNVRAAEAAARISGANRLPSLSAGLRPSRSQTMASFQPPAAVESETYSLALNARWEIDLWSRLAEEHTSAKAQYRASEYEFQYFRLSLAAQVARAWFNLIESKTQFELAEASANAFDAKLATLESRYERGLVDAFDLRLTRAQASTSRASALRRRNQMDASIRLLETLLGRYPSAELAIESELPELAATPSAGLPSELLERRPDVLAQQNRLLSALALERSAVRNWLPSITLTASDGTLSNQFSDLLDSNFNVWTLAGDIGFALFQGGRLKGQREQLQANQLSQLAQYKDVVLTAFREVETALRAEADLHDLERQTQISASENQLAEDQAWQLYQRGLVDITAVLDSERRSFEAQSQLLSIRNQRLQNRISLHLALGGNIQL